MTKFHIDDDGETGLCKSTQGRCPFGSDADHHESAEAARVAFEHSRGNSFEPHGVHTALSKPFIPQVKRDARKIAQKAAGRSLPADRVWIEHHPAVGGYQVRYTLPRTNGFFICDERLSMSRDEFEAYEEWEADQA